jgi:CHAD domain-containing protein
MKRFSHYAKRRLKSLSDDLDDFGDHPRPELLHRIRLGVKKMKAIFNVTEFCVKGFNAHKHYRPFRSIFRKAGEIRQTDVLDELISRFKINPEVVAGKTNLDNRRLISSFQKGVPSFISSLEKQKRLVDSFKTVKRLCFNNYLNLKKQELKRELYPLLNQHELHKTRKTIKEILYLSPITRKSIPDPFYNKLQVMIGEWHDKQIVLILLKTHKNSVEQKQLQAECGHDIANINRLIRQFYTR